MSKAAPSRGACALQPIGWRQAIASARADVVNNARGYATLLRQHIQKENGILFPMADQVIPVTQRAEVAADFERVEHEDTGEGVHEKYLALAEALEREAA